MISRDKLPRMYPICPLGELVEFLDHRRKPVKESERVPGPYPYYGANGMQGTIDKYLFDEPLLLLAEDGGHFDNPSRGIAYPVFGKTWVNNHAHVLRPRSTVDIRYLFRTLQHYDVRPWVTGTTRGKLTKAGASQILVPLPPLSEQRRIAEILDKADALRAKRREAIAKLDQLLQAVFLEMFGDPVENTKNWPMVRVGDQFSDFVGGKNIECPDSSSSPYRILKVSAVTKTVYAPNESKAAPDDFEPASNAIVRKGDLLFSRANTSELVAATAFVWDTPVNMVLPDKLWRMVKSPGAELEDLFVWELFKNRSFRSELAKRSSGTSGSMKNIAKGKLVDVPMPLPSLALQSQFAKFSRSLHRQKQRLDEQMVKIEQANGSLTSVFFGD